MIRHFVANIPLAGSTNRRIVSNIPAIFKLEQMRPLFCTRHSFNKSLHQNATATSTKIDNEGNNEDEEKPVTFTKSKAFKTTPTFINPKARKTPKPFLQDISIFISLSCFMIYFFMYREENDLDEILGVSLYDRIDGLEKANIFAAIRYNEREGLDTTKLKVRLEEIIAEENRNNAEFNEKEKELSKMYQK